MCDFGYQHHHQHSQQPNRTRENDRGSQPRSYRAFGPYDQSQPVDRKRIEAARAIIEYEAPPDVFDVTRQFLMGIAEAPEQDVEWVLKALQLVRKVE